MIEQVLPFELLWRNALAVVPLALLVAVICRVVPCKPSTRHALWLTVLVLMVATPLIPRLALPQLPADPAAVTVDTPPREFPRRRDREVTAPTASPGPPVTASSTLVPAGPAPISPVRPLPGPRAVAPGEPATVFAPSAWIVQAPPRVEPVTQPRWIPARPATAAAASDSVASPPAGEPMPELAVAVEPPPPPAADGAWRRWTAQLGAVRDAVMSLPPIPARVWLAGLVALLVLAAIRTVRSHGILRRGRAAPPSVDRAVAEVARELGIRRAPETLMVDLPVAPMLWCGRRVRLVLPRPLWAQLDEIGRRAVICHELAHLRRRDHWVCRAEMIVGWLYWWNPVVWWVRRRVRDEADLSCDAWVTALLPHGRRAYAQALLEARRGAWTDLSAAPCVGLGASTRRARRFARRLTMVMTAHNSPRLSRKGFVLAGTLMLGGLLVTPIWACPDAEKEARAPKPSACPEAKKAKKAETKLEIIVPAQPPCAPEPPAARPTTFEAYMYGQGQEDDLDRRMRDLERKLDLLSKELKTLMHDMQAGQAQAPMPAPPPQIKTYASAGEGDLVVRTYKLPKGKLAAITALMIRQDVPILVRPGDSEIEVHATPEHQMIFEAFCTMINGEEEEVAYALPEGKLQALNELMIRSDVPIMVEPGDTEITVRGTDLEQLVFKAFVNMINPGAKTAKTGGAPRAAAGDAAQAYARALADLAHQYETSAAAQMAELAELRAAMRSLERQARAVERQADKLEQEADKYWDKAEQLEDDAQELLADAEKVEGTKRNEMLVKAEAFMKKAEALRQQAEAIEAQAEALDAQADELDDKAEGIEDKIEALEELEGED